MVDSKALTNVEKQPYEFIKESLPKMSEREMDKFLAFCEGLTYRDDDHRHKVPELKEA